MYTIQQHTITGNKLDSYEVAEINIFRPRIIYVGGIGDLCDGLETSHGGQELFNQTAGFLHSCDFYSLSSAYPESYDVFYADTINPNPLIVPEVAQTIIDNFFPDSILAPNDIQGTKAAIGKNIFATFCLGSRVVESKVKDRLRILLAEKGFTDAQIAELTPAVKSLNILATHTIRETDGPCFTSVNLYNGRDPRSALHACPEHIALLQNLPNPYSTFCQNAENGKIAADHNIDDIRHEQYATRQIGNRILICSSSLLGIYEARKLRSQDPAIADRLKYDTDGNLRVPETQLHEHCIRMSLNRTRSMNVANIYGNIPTISAANRDMVTFQRFGAAHFVPDILNTMIDDARGLTDNLMENLTGLLCTGAAKKEAIANLNLAWRTYRESSSNIR